MPTARTAAPKPTDDPADTILATLPPRIVPEGLDPAEDEVVLPSPFPGTVRLMSTAEYGARLAALLAPFPPGELERLPKALRNDRDQPKGRCSDGFSVDGFDCGGWHARSIHLTYVGHAGVTARLLAVDPLYTLEPVEVTDHGVPVVRPDGAWFRLTVLGMTRLGFGDAAGKSGANATKEVIGDALRNAALRFGVATYLWSKSEDAQVLAAGGAVSDDGPPAAPRPEPTPRARRQEAAPQELAPEVLAPMPGTTAVTYLARIVEAVNLRPEPGPVRDADLRAIYAEVGAANGLGTTVPLPTAWTPDGEERSVPLAEVIAAARGAKPIGASADPEDPWATEPPA